MEDKRSFQPNPLTKANTQHGLEGWLVGFLVSALSWWVYTYVNPEVSGYMIVLLFGLVSLAVIPELHEAREIRARDSLKPREAFWEGFFWPLLVFKYFLSLIDA